MEPILQTVFAVFAVSPGEGKTLCMEGERITLRDFGWEDASQADSALSPTEESSPIRPLEEECVYLLEGELTFQLDGQARTLQRGGYLMAPSGVPQVLKNEGEKIARMLVIVTPSGLNA